jgi:hypothetical protein
MLNKITQVLKSKPGLKAIDIARELKTGRTQINQILYSNKDIFICEDVTYLWFLAVDAEFILNMTAKGKWITQHNFEQELSKSGSPLDSLHGQVVIRITDEKYLLLCAAARILVLSNQLVDSGKKVTLDFTNNEQTLSYLHRACFFDRLDKKVKVLPKRPSLKVAKRLIGNNGGLVELLEICDEDNVPERLKYCFTEAYGSVETYKRKYANKLFTLVAEMVSNVEDHSQTTIPGFAGLQSYKPANKNTLVVVISDSGKGICSTLRPELEKNFPVEAKKFPALLADSDPKLILYAMEKGGLSRRGKGQGGAGLHKAQEEAAKLNASLCIRQKNFSLTINFKNGLLERHEWKLGLPTLHGTHVVFEFRLTED